MPFTADDYSINLRRYREGGAGSPDDKGHTYVNPFSAQIVSYLVAGTADDGEYTFTLENEATGDLFTASFTRGSGETNAQIAAALIDDWNAAFEGIGFAYEGATPETVEIALLDSQTTYIENATSAPGTGTLTYSLEQAKGGVVCRASTFVAAEVDAVDTKEDSNGSLRRLAAGDTVADIIGAVRTGVIYPENDPDDPGIPAGEHATVISDGRPVLLAETALVKNGPIFARIDGSGILGAVRNDNDGGNAIDISSIARVIEDIADPGGEPALTRLRVFIPLA